MTQITGKIYQQTNAAGTENRFPRTVMEAVLGLNSYLQNQFSSLSDIYMPIEGINEAKPNQEFVYRKTPNTINAKALTLDSIKGKTLAWNQLVPDANINYTNTSTDTRNWLNLTMLAYQGSTYIGGLISRDYDSAIRVAEIVVLPSNCDTIFYKHNGQNLDLMIWESHSVVGGHTYYVESNVVSANPSVVGGLVVNNNRFTDLTLLFGAGNEPTTVAEFQALYAKSSPYNAGELKSNDAASIKTVGFNLLDEEWEAGALDIWGAGGPIDNNDYKRMVNFMPCLPSTQYYFKGGYNGNGWRISMYDANKVYLGSATGFVEACNSVITTAVNARYLRCYLPKDYVNQNCINFSNADKNGTYEPYSPSTLPLNLDSIKVISPNIWDGEYESGAYYTWESSGDGSKVSASGYMRCANYIPVAPNTNYYIKEGKGYQARISFYDSDKNYIGYSSCISKVNETFTTPTNAYYMAFYIDDSSSYSTYSVGDICINVANPAFNGNYYPYGIITINGGLKGVNAGCDEIIGNKLHRRVNRKELGRMSWDLDSGGFWYTGELPLNLRNSTAKTVQPFTDDYTKNNPQLGWYYLSGAGYFEVYVPSASTSEDTQRALTGVYIDYLLPNEEVYDLAEPIPMSMPAGTTESRISPNADGLSAPFCADITYGMGATEYAETAGVALNAISTQYAEATARLLTPRTIWGQVFDGSANISGALSGVTNLNSKLYFSGANVGIGTSSPLYSLDVSGTFHASGNTEIGGSLIVDGGLTVPQYAGLNFEGASDVWLASLGLNSNADQLIVSFGADDDHVLLHDGNYTSYSPSLTQFNTSNGVLAEGIASNASRLDSLEDWLTDPRLTSLYSDSLSADSLNVPGNATLGAVTATSLVCAALSSVGNINSKIYFSGANVGIANSSPSYGLDVAGTFRATGNSVFGGMMYANDMEVKSIVSQYDYEWDSEIDPIQCFEITEDGDASFFNVSVYESVKILGYYNGDHEFGTATLSYVYDPYDTSSIVADKSITAPSFIQSSDARLKTDLAPIALTVEQIASAPAVEFNWIGNGQRSAGSIAQYWENTLPYNVHHSGETLTMEYGNIALLSAITCAREIQKLEARIKELEAKLNN